MDEYNGQGALRDDYVPKMLSNGKWVTDPLRAPESPTKPNPWLKILQDILKDIEQDELMRTGRGEVKNAAD